MSELTPEAEQVLKYLVLNATPEDFVPLDRIEQSINLYDIPFRDATAEMEAFSLIDMSPGHVRPRAYAWEVAGADLGGFDVRADAVKVAQAVADAKDWIESQQLEELTALPVVRLNIAALLLHDEDKIELLKALGTFPYAFVSARATYQTRKWLRTIEARLNRGEKLSKIANSDGEWKLVAFRLNVTPEDTEIAKFATLLKMPSQRVFISYRRDDSAGHAGHLHSDLTQRYGTDKIFMDLAIEPGVDFIDTIKEAVGSCKVLLAIIGRQWLSVADPTTGMRRLDSPDDFVRTEIATALQRDIRVIPVLVHHAQMPHANALPDDLKPLARRQAHELTDSRWDYDVSCLLKVLDKIVSFRE